MGKRTGRWVDGRRVMHDGVLGWYCDCDEYRREGDCTHSRRAAALEQFERALRKAVTESAVAGGRTRSLH